MISNVYNRENNGNFYTPKRKRPNGEVYGR